jgi:RNA polymerase sigma-70 factor (ECF subfamily)
MIRIVRALDRFDGRASFATWTFRIATNAALDELRKRGRRPQLHVASGEGDEAWAERERADTHAQRTVEGVADRIAIQAALAELPEEFRVPVVMRDVGDLDYAEIAEALHVPIGTVKSRIARGRRMLVDRLGNRDDPSQRPTTEQPTGDQPAAPPPAPSDPPPTHP